MKRIFNSILCFSAVALLAISCDVTGIGTIYEPSASNEGVTFLQTNSIDTEVSASAATFDIVVARSKSDKAISVAISTTLPEVIKVPTSVSFNAGESEAKLSLDISNISVGKTYSGKVTIEGEDATDKNFSISSITVKLAKAFTWEDYGTCTITDDIVTAFFGVSNVSWTVKAQKAEGLEFYKVLDPYGEDYPYNEPGDFTPGASWVFNCTDPNKVTFDKTGLGFDWGYGEFTIQQAAYGTFKDNTLTFPVEGLYLTMGNYASYANGDGLFKMVFKKQ